jgi:predicted lysophospholipase L1 biosynthesis ABC-type transport system permease subunit
MTPVKKSIVILAFALELAVAATATATAKSRAVHTGYQARAQVTEDVMEGGVSVSSERVKALQECNARIAGFKGYNQMRTPVSIYRSCMYDHGQAE